ncbi:MAG: aminotransferase class III-fold pyridoxal phosphate-dependent enzyme, partial [Cyanobacteria bacterium HKST-UBA05]|nr:aminotransferase class III-fold pyridoxal phosphate-dependent enzyme [Cyanobacteria bacterium HKST-UBA05]
GFLEGLRTLCSTHGALLIFDEVMTGFRVHYGGAQSRYNVTPDITALGKVIGGGLPVGAYGASKAIMENVAPLGPMYQAGTLSGNPLAMGAGLATLSQLKAGAKADLYDNLLTTTTQLALGIQTRAAEHGLETQVHIVGSMFSVFFASHPIHNYADVSRADKALFTKVFHGLLAQGVYMAPSPFEAGFVSAAHTTADIEATLAAVDRVFDQLQP